MPPRFQDNTYTYTYDQQGGEHELEITDNASHIQAYYFHDSLGNVTTRQEYTHDGTLLRELDFIYNDDNRLIEVKDLTQGSPGVLVATYTYNGLGQRVKKHVCQPVDKTIIYLYDLYGNLIAERSANYIDYVYLDGRERLAMIVYTGQAINIYYFNNDHLGRPVAMTELDLTKKHYDVMWKASYTAFGKAQVHGSSRIENNLRFPGQYYDEETGLHYNYHRYYDPGTGRYLSADPVGLEGGINLFVYSKNNPIIYFDFLGLACGDKWTDWAVSDTPGGFDFSDCCQKHDDCYGKAGKKCNKSKKQCDDEFFECMERKCRLRYLSSRACQKEANRYWNAVDKYGEGAFEDARE